MSKDIILRSQKAIRLLLQLCEVVRETSVKICNPDEYISRDAFQSLLE